MVGVDDYGRLLGYVYRFCGKYRHMNYKDLAHDILLSGEYEEGKVHKLCRKYMSNYSGKGIVISLSDIGDFTSSRRDIEYKWCYHCNDYLPLDYFTYCGKTSNSCIFYELEKKGLTEKKKRNNLSDSYLRDVIKKRGVRKEDITPQMIIESRQSILKRRAKKLA